MHSILFIYLLFYKLNQEESKVLQNKIIERRKEIHLETTKQALARWNYEECVCI